MSEYICNIYYKKFNSPSHLERHKNNKTHCGKTNICKDALMNYIRDASGKNTTSKGTS